ncbi:MAG: NAD(P)/FAD-dependent oxidoreductase [Magnetospirillum gryphiswaldense]|nr:NAD(P)/FAD-dependent oxidoreductase [Magnetospirillum gryphiswaldense]
MQYDVIIIGAGAAGLMAAASAGQRGRKVLVLDHGEKAGAKILISGGGRCNFTNRNIAPDRYLSANPHYAKSALKRFSQADFINLVNKYKIAFHERDLGQLFCDQSSALILNMLLDECGAGSVAFKLDVKVGQIIGSGPYSVTTDAGTFTAPSMVVATGGLSIPKLGATGFAHGVARDYGLAVTELRPALVPLVFTAADLDFMRALTGIAVDGVARCGKTSFREAILFTHRGLSGPAILQISSYWREGQEILVNLAPDLDVAARLIERKSERPKAEAKTVLAEMLPARLADSLAERAGIGKKPMAELANKALQDLGRMVNAWSLKPAGTEGWRTAEVTLGGVDTDALSSKTMEAKAHPGLFFVGEAVDVTGWLGGYNFQWAWSSGWVAGQHC